MDGKVAFITGAASGIGRATADVLAAEGAKVVIADVNDSEADNTLAIIQAGGGTGMAVHVDVTDELQVARAVTDTVASFGSLDCAVNCAAITLGLDRPRAADVTTDTFDRIVAINLRGVFLSMKYELKQMIQQRSGSIVNIASVSGVVGTPGNAAYVAAKHGVVGLTKAAAVDHGGDGIRVNVVCPGMTDTPMIAAQSTGNTPKIPAGVLVGRMAEPDEIAQAIAWYCSPRASYAHGAVITIDGGYVTG